MREAPSPEEIAVAVEAALGAHPAAVEPVVGGANNSVTKVTVGQEVYIAKLYFADGRDSRDRLGAEFGVMTFLWDNGIRSIPRPITADRKHRTAIYEFIPGDRPIRGQVSLSDVYQLVDFLSAMWSLRTMPGADQLGNASEASFSLADYHASLRKRVNCVENTLKDDPSALEAFEFVRDEVRAAYGRVSDFVEDRAREYQIELDGELPVNSRTLSPADHGFHNTLRIRSGKLIFLDFEYAGWDQPAQMLANACLQPEIPLPLEYRKSFINAMTSRLDADEELLFQLRLLYPMLSLKWSLIMLGEFLHVERARRAFAGMNTDEHRAAQLWKSKRQLEMTDYALSNRFFLDELMQDLKIVPGRF